MPSLHLTQKCYPCLDTRIRYRSPETEQLTPQTKCLSPPSGAFPLFDCFVPWGSRPRLNVCRPLRGLSRCLIALFPGAHAPGYISVAPTALITASRAMTCPTAERSTSREIPSCRRWFSVEPPALQRFIARQSTDVIPNERKMWPPPCHPDGASNASERRDPWVVWESAEFSTGLS